MHGFFEVDVFGTGPFTGNPLAVVAGAGDLSDEQMARIAAWTNFSETTFLLPPVDERADYRVRILTPRGEYPFAGHPTLGSARVAMALGCRPDADGALVQECGAGLVRVRVDGDLLWFATPPRTRTDDLDDDELAAVADALCIAPGDVVAAAWGSNGPEWRLVQLADADAVRALRPRPDRGDLRIGVVGMGAAGGDVAYEVRAFGTTYEDPVTGSLQGALAEWLATRGLVPERYVVAQGSQVGRAGRVHVHDDGTDVWIGGTAEVMVRGRLAL